MVSCLPKQRALEGLLHGGGDDEAEDEVVKKRSRVSNDREDPNGYTRRLEVSRHRQTLIGLEVRIGGQHCGILDQLGNADGQHNIARNGERPVQSPSGERDQQQYDG